MPPLSGRRRALVDTMGGCHAVAADPEGDVAKAYDVLLRFGGGIIADRTSYVVTPDGRIASVLTAGDAGSHIQSALTSVKAWKGRQAR